MKILKSLIKTINKFSDAMEKSSLKTTSATSRKTYLPIIGEPNEPRDTVIVTDISGSMGNYDFLPTRLKGAIEAGIEYVNARKNPKDRIALISFSTKAKTLIPLSSVKNKGNIISALQSLSIDGGTDIKKGLQAAIDVFSQEKSDSQRYVILLTDGHGGEPLAAAKVLKEQYCAIVEVIGIGGTPRTVNESLLRKIAMTDSDGFTHYRFIKNSAGLKKHYKELATGLIWNGSQDD